MVLMKKKMINQLIKLKYLRRKRELKSMWLNNSKMKPNLKLKWMMVHMITLICMRHPGLEKK